MPKKDRYWTSHNWTREAEGAPGLIRPPSRRLGAIVSIKLKADEFTALRLVSRRAGYRLMTDFHKDLALLAGLPYRTESLPIEKLEKLEKLMRMLAETSILLPSMISNDSTSPNLGSHDTGPDSR
jgi:hypothetical protein